MSKTNKTLIIIHCSDTFEHMDIGVKEIRRWHVQERGWRDIGYNWVIRRNGVVEGGRDLDNDGDYFEEIGAHTAGKNAISVGICLIGGRGKSGQPENNFTPEQFKALEKLIRVIKADHPHMTVHGHREFANKACPSFDVQEWLKTVKL